MVTRGEIDQPRRRRCRSYQRVKPVLRHDGVDALFAGKFVILFQSFQVCRSSERALALRLDHDVLAEIGHLFGGVLLIEVDNVFHGLHRRLRAQPFEVSVQIGFEFV